MYYVFIYVTKFAFCKLTNICVIIPLLSYKNIHIAEELFYL